MIYVQIFSLFDNIIEIVILLSCKLGDFWIA